MPWPTTAEIQSLIAAAGVTLDYTDADLDLELAVAIDLTQRILDRSYTLVTAARRFDGNDRTELELPAFQSITKIEYVNVAGEVQEELDANTYLAYPANSLPKYKVRRVQNSAFQSSDPYYLAYMGYPTDVRIRIRRGYWPIGSQNFLITAVWGDAASPPPAVQQMALRLAAIQLLGGGVDTFVGGIVRWRESDGSEEDLGDKPYTGAIDFWQRGVDRTIRQYRRRRLLIGA
jgi:hypothetical protein